MSIDVCNSPAIDIVLEGDCDNCAALEKEIAKKQDKLTAGSNISISGNTISATNTEYSAGAGISINNNTKVISATAASYTGTAPISVSGNNISHDNSGAAAGTYGTNSSTALTPDYGGTFSVPGFAVTNKGHVSSASSHTVKIPNSTATTSKSGLMSPQDKTDLDDAFKQLGTLPSGTTIATTRKSGGYTYVSSNNYTGLPDGFNYGNILQWRSSDSSSYATQLLTTFLGAQGERVTRAAIKMRAGEGDWTRYCELMLSDGILYDGAVLTSILRPGVFYLLGDNNYTGWGSSYINSKLHQYGVFIVFEPMFLSDVTAQMIITDNGYAVRYRNLNNWSDWMITYLNRSVATYTYRGLNISVESQSCAVTVHITGSPTSNLTTSENTITLCTLAEQFRPTQPFVYTGFVTSGSSANARYGNLTIATDGTVTLGYTYTPGGSAAVVPSGSTFRFSCTYVIQ